MYLFVVSPRDQSSSLRSVNSCSNSTRTLRRNSSLKATSGGGRQSLEFDCGLFRNPEWPGDECASVLDQGSSASNRRLFGGRSSSISSIPGIDVARFLRGTAVHFVPEPVSSKLKVGWSICGALSAIGWGVTTTGVADLDASRAVVMSWAYELRWKAHRSFRHAPYHFVRASTPGESSPSRADKNVLGTPRQQQRPLCVSGTEDDIMGADGSYGRLLGDCVPGLDPSTGTVSGCGCNIGGPRVVPSSGESSNSCGADPFVLARCGRVVKGLS